METALPTPDASQRGLSIRMLGPLSVTRDGPRIDLPASRKLRALLACLALSPAPLTRSRLCDLLWDGPNDPRAELRWTLSRLRTVVDEPARERIHATTDLVALDLHGCFVDALAVSGAAERGLDHLGAEELGALCALFRGDLIDGLEIDRSPVFGSWLAAQRRRFRAIRTAILQRLVDLLPPGEDERLRRIEALVELCPFDVRAHGLLLGALAGRGRMADAEEHVAATARLYEGDGLDASPLRAAWRDIVARHGNDVAQTPVVANVTMEPAAQEPGLHGPPRASLAVMPFREETHGPQRGGVADGLTHDVITRLAKLRDFFVIARGSVFALAEQKLGPEDAGRKLKVDYVASGFVRTSASRVTVGIELVEVRTARIVWTEVFDHRIDDTFMVLDEIGNRIVASIANEIEIAERNSAILKTPTSLNAWEAYHRGLWHMYRFTRDDNDHARHFFDTAIGLDPTFARAHAGLSFTHWQSAFQRWGDRQYESDRAYAAAGQSLIVDDHNPSAHWAMGRALWLRGREDEAVRELETAVDLSPNFALGHYALSFVQSQSGDAKAAIGSSDHSRHLSPFDPLLFGMLGARAMAHVRLGQFEEAAEWALKAAARPTAHAIIIAIAMHCLGLAGRIDEGRAMSASLRKVHPNYRADDFLKTFRFTSDAEALFREGARRIGLG